MRAFFEGHMQLTALSGEEVENGAAMRGQDGLLQTWGTQTTSYFSSIPCNRVACLSNGVIPSAFVPLARVRGAVRPWDWRLE